MAKGYWTCQRSTGGTVCKALNANRKRKCGRCGKPRPTRKPPAHMAALDLTYEHYVELQGGEFCGICGREPAKGKQLMRDHAHVGSGIPRGLLCWRHNLGLNNFGDDPALLRAAADYVERAGSNAR
jgi:hypothetical protein